MTTPELSDVKRKLLSRLLAGDVRPAPRRIPYADPARRVRLSAAQERIWLAAQLAPGTSVFHLVMLASVPVRLDAALIERSLRDVVARHDCLRMSVEVDGGLPLMAVHGSDAVGVRVPVADLSARPDPRAAAVAYAEEVARRPYRLDEAPLWRAEIIRLDAETSMLLFAVHHLIADATSLDLIAREIADPASRRQLPVSYRDFAAWQRDEAAAGKLAPALAHWKDELAGVTTSLHLPRDRSRPALPDLAGRTLQFDVPAATTARLRALSKTEGVTPYVLHLAVLGVLLSRYTHHKDVLVGTYLAGRGEPELQDLVGMFVNLVPVRVRTGGDPTLRELAGRVRTATAGAYAHQHVPFEQLVQQAERGTSRSEPPLVQVGFNMLRLKSTAFGEAVDMPISQDVSQLDLTVHVVERADGTHNLMMEYATSLFDAASVEQLAGHYLNLLDRLGAAPDAPVSRIPTLTGRGTPAPDGPARRRPLLADAFAAQVRERPDAVAVRAGERTVTYRELDALAERLAAALRAAGERPEQPVGVCLERGLPLVVALLAVWRTGAPYLPLDPEHPPARWATVLTEAGAGLVVAGPGRPGHPAPAGPAGTVTLDAEGAVADPAPPSGTSGASPAGPGTSGASPAGPDAAAYVLFTSGSTGTPKGVVISHAGIANRVWWSVHTHRLTDRDLVLQKTRIGFDAAGWEVFAPPRGRRHRRPGAPRRGTRPGGPAARRRRHRCHGSSGGAIGPAASGGTARLGGLRSAAPASLGGRTAGRGAVRTGAGTATGGDLEHLRAHRVLRRRHRPPVRPAPEGRHRADRPPPRRHASPCRRRGRKPRPGQRARRTADRRAGSGPGVRGQARPHRRTLRSRPLRPARFPGLPHRRPGAPRPRRRAALRGQGRRPDQDQRCPHRTRRGHRRPAARPADGGRPRAGRTRR
ncbi:hypothetical protein GCM10018987_06130 [Streptomyces cremeus]